MNTTKKALYVIIILVMCMVYSTQCIHAGNELVFQGIKDYAVVDTGQLGCFDDEGELLTCPSIGEPFYGQDNQYDGDQPSYTDNGNGTVTDNVTGLMWQQSADTDGNGDIDADDKLTYDEAIARAQALNVGGHSDWRLPTIKELYSLIDFSGIDPSGYEGTDTSGLIPFIDTGYFDFAYGDTDTGERIIDAQYASSDLYVGGNAGDGGGTLFGVNFADGRIKGYGLSLLGLEKTFFVICVRGNTGYGLNDFEDNGDGTITDYATDLMWSQEDSGEGFNWQNALAWVVEKNAENYIGYSDWRLPNAKELQSIVDYTRSPDSTGTAAIDPLLRTTVISNEAGEADFPYYWSGTTHTNGSNASGTYGVYVAFGRAMGYMDGAWVDLHGAGAQRSDPKAGDSSNYPFGNGPQGDAVRITNYARLVRDANLGQTSFRKVSENANDMKQQILPDDSENSRVDASVNIETFPATTYNNWMSIKLEELFTVGLDESGWLDIDPNYFSIDVTNDINLQQYLHSNIYNSGANQDELDSTVEGNILTIDTQGNISGILGKILERQIEYHDD